MTFNKEKALELEQAWLKAKAEGKETFEFDGVELLTNYARYLVTYLKKTLCNSNSPKTS